MAISLSVDGTDLSTLGLEPISGISGWRSKPTAEWPTTPVPGRFGEELLSSRPRILARVLEVPCILTGTSASNFRSNLQDLNDHLDASRTADMLVTFSTDSSVEFRARAAQVDDALVNTAIATTAAEIRLRFFCPDPRIYEQAGSSVTGITTATAIPLGNAPTEPNLRFNGPFTDPIANYRNSGGTILASVELTGSKSTSEWVDVDMVTGEIVDDGGADQSSMMTGGEFFSLDPQDGDFNTDTWPTLSVTDGDLNVTYDKAYLAGG